MNAQLTIEQRFALTRARYEVTRMSRPALEKTALRLLKSRMEQKNGVQETLMSNGIIFKIDEQQSGLPEIISEETFCELLELNVDNSEEMPL
jgi:type II secretory pathway predicted ATPase ExeA